MNNGFLKNVETYVCKEDRLKKIEKKKLLILQATLIRKINM